MEKSDTRNKPLVEKILFLETNSEFYSFFRNMYLTLGRLCNNMLHFNRRDNYFKYGRKKMNEMLLDLIKREKPDYIFTWLTWDEFYIETLMKINEISPNTKTVAIFGDDTIQFEDFSRYYALLFNYVFTTLKSYQGKYKQEGLNDAYFTSLTDAVAFRPIKSQKKYDVTFVGSQKLDKSGRYELVKHLIDNGISVKVFGFGWENHPELKENYGGALESEDVVKVINESKINLCLSKDNFGRPQMKAKIFEVGACKSFALCEHAPDYENYFKEGKEIVYFKDKHELLEKVKYYLSHEKEREKLASGSYKRVIDDYALETELRKFILNTKDDNKKVSLPKLNKSVYKITKDNIDIDLEDLKNNLAPYDFVSFHKDKAEHLSYKEYMQIYGMLKSGKQISCCNYYVHSSTLGDYLLFFTRDGLNLLDKPDFDSLLDINQLVVSKDYFLKNYDMLKQAFHSNKIDFVNKQNTIFVAMPLLRLSKLKTKDYGLIKKAFGLKFTYDLYSHVYQKKLFSSIYPYSLSFSMLNKPFIYKAIKELVKDKATRAKFSKM